MSYCMCQRKATTCAVPGWKWPMQPAWAAIPRAASMIKLHAMPRDDFTVLHSAQTGAPGGRRALASSRAVTRVSLRWFHCNLYASRVAWTARLLCYLAMASVCVQYDLRMHPWRHLLRAQRCLVVAVAAESAACDVARPACVTRAHPPRRAAAAAAEVICGWRAGRERVVASRVPPMSSRLQCLRKTRGGLQILADERDDEPHGREAVVRLEVAPKVHTIAASSTAPASELRRVQKEEQW